MVQGTKSRRGDLRTRRGSHLDRGITFNPITYLCPNEEQARIPGNPRPSDLNHQSRSQRWAQETPEQEGTQKKMTVHRETTTRRLIEDWFADQRNQRRSRPRKGGAASAGHSAGEPAPRLVGEAATGIAVPGSNSRRQYVPVRREPAASEFIQQHRNTLPDVVDEQPNIDRWTRSKAYA